MPLKGSETLSHSRLMALGATQRVTDRDSIRVSRATDAAAALSMSIRVSLPARLHPQVTLGSALTAAVVSSLASQVTYLSI